MWHSRILFRRDDGHLCAGFAVVAFLLCVLFFILVQIGGGPPAGLPILYPTFSTRKGGGKIEEFEGPEIEFGLEGETEGDTLFDMGLVEVDEDGGAWGVELSDHKSDLKPVGEPEVIGSSRKKKKGGGKEKERKHGHKKSRAHSPVTSEASDDVAADTAPPVTKSAESSKETAVEIENRSEEAKHVKSDQKTDQKTEGGGATRRLLKFSKAVRDGRDEVTEKGEEEVPAVSVQAYPPCDRRYTDATPCHEGEDRFRRICPPANELPSCITTPPPGWQRPPPWPESLHTAWYANIPSPFLATHKAEQNWVTVDREGGKLNFPGGGTSFPEGADHYVEALEQLLPLGGGEIRTALDTGCGVASFGGTLLHHSILTLSLAPRDGHESQLQFASERGLPALLGALSSQRLPFPSAAFDLAHCARCLINWTEHDGRALTEIDRVLRSGGYWVLSGPPVNCAKYAAGWKISKEECRRQFAEIADLAERMCWEVVAKKGVFAIWQKSKDQSCVANRAEGRHPPICDLEKGGEGGAKIRLYERQRMHDIGWYQPAQPCLIPHFHSFEGGHTSGGGLLPWPERLQATPPRIRNSLTKGFDSDKYESEIQKWKRRVDHYREDLLSDWSAGRYRNILDMNSYLGSFAAALVDSPVWVMNVVLPYDDVVDTLGVIFERGLIGTYHDWCEPFSTYPRTYDFVHGDGVFNHTRGRCPMSGLLLEVDRIMRPEGSAIFRDKLPLLRQAAEHLVAMRWDARIVDDREGGSLLVCVKKYWTD